MAEENETANEQVTNPESNDEPHGDGTDWKAMARKWESQSKANNARIKELEEQSKALQEKAAKFDEYEASQKTELERANDAATKAQTEAADWKARFEAMQAEQERTASVAQFASQYNVDAGVLSRMTGDVEDNAKYLAGIEAARPKFPETRDGGENASAPLTKEQILAEKDRSKRLALIQQNLSLFGR